MSGTAGAGRTVLGHPRGLLVLFGTEGFLSFGYYGMQSILVLFLSAALLRPGHAEHVLGLRALEQLLGLPAAAGIEARAVALSGLVGAFAYATPLLGGVVADRLLGRTRATACGLLLLSLGFALLAVEPLFLFGLALVMAGFGLSGTLKAQLGALYATEDPRRADGFQLWSFSVMFAVLAAPVVCGTLGEDYAWRWGFLAAAAGAASALGVYLAGARTLPAEP
ncbi:MAG: MFS transporter, partial [Gluconacetobacter diazotrophicus]|nr:MFS transporter [Gluconacetobacter diazotrophicus]